MAKKFIIKGVGTFMAKRYAKDGKGVEVLTLGTLQSLKIDLNVEIEDIFGGDGMFAIDTLVKSKSIEISATDAKFDLDALQLMMGSAVREGVVDDSIWVLNEQKVLLADDPALPTAATITVEYGATLFGDGNFQVRLKDENKLLKKVATAPAETEFSVDATGEITLHKDHVGKDVVVNYQRKEIVDVVDILADEVPFPVHVIHHGSFLQKDGTFQGVETELYQCRAKGTFSIDAQRATASSSAIQLQVLDPERADGKLGTIKRYGGVKKS